MCETILPTILSLSQFWLIDLRNVSDLQQVWDDLEIRIIKFKSQNILPEFGHKPVVIHPQFQYIWGLS